MHYARSSSPAPFHKAILESGATTARAVFYPTHPRHLVQFREFLIAAGADGIPESQIFSHLRTLPLETIVTASKAVWDKYVEHVTWPFQPVIDGPNPLANSSHTQPDPIIPTLPITSWLNGSHLHIPILTGYNTNEGTMFIPPKADTSSDFRSFFQSLIPSMTEADLDRLEALYPDPLTSPADNNPYKSVPRGMGRQWARLDAAYSHYAYICPVLQTAHFMSKNSSKKDRVYVYRYAATSTWGTANHVDEVPAVVYDMNVLRGKPGLEQVAKAMHGMWARFVASPVGDPNPNPTSTFDSDSDSASGEGNGRSKKAAAVEWPVFLSPFSDDGPTWSASPADRRNRRVADGSGSGSGSIMVFGEGNNEREPGKLIKNRGIPAQVQELSGFEKVACRFWWERVWLSQGLGNAHRTAKL
jgi:carboxylesterase type B